MDWIGLDFREFLLYFSNMCISLKEIIFIGELVGRWTCIILNLPSIHSLLLKYKEVRFGLMHDLRHIPEVLNVFIGPLFLFQ